MNKISGDLHFHNKLQTRKDFKLNGCHPVLVLTNFLQHRFSIDCDGIKWHYHRVLDRFRLKRCTAQSYIGLSITERQFAEIAINQYTNGQTQLYKITFGKTSHLPSSFQLGNISSTGRSGIDFACLCWSHKLFGTDKRKRDSSWRFVGRNLYSHHNSTHHSVCPSLYRHKSSRPRFRHHLLQQRLNKRGYKTSLSLK